MSAPAELLDLPLFQYGGRTFDAKLDAERLGAQLTRVIQAMSDIRKLYGEQAMESRRRTEDGVDGLWEYRSNVVLGEAQ